jgi:hypothetical protein
MRCLTFPGKLLQFIKVIKKEKLPGRHFFEIINITKNKPVCFFEFKTKPKMNDSSFLEAELNQKQINLFFEI